MPFLLRRIISAILGIVLGGLIALWIATLFLPKLNPDSSNDKAWFIHLAIAQACGILGAILAALPSLRRCPSLSSSLSSVLLPLLATALLTGLAGSTAAESLFVLVIVMSSTVPAALTGLFTVHILARTPDAAFV